MNDLNNNERGQFQSKIGFILAAAGSAVGLGSIWKFPYEVGQNGGGAYVLVYLIAVVVLAIPVMIAEFVIGRNTGKNAVQAYAHYSKKYQIVGIISLIIPSVILSFYGVIGGWGIMYIYLTLTGKLTGLTPDGYGDLFASVSANTGMAGIFFILFMLLTIIVVMKGVEDGIEKVCTFLMPALFVIMVVLAIVGMTQPGGMEGVKWYLKPDFSVITPSMFIKAIGMVFFTLSLGMGIMVTYASYLSKEEDIPKAATVTIFFDTAVSLLAGFAIFPAVFAFGLAPNSGPGLVFVTLPNVFDKLPGGQLIGLAFYFLLVFAALPAAISLLEVPVSYLIDAKNFDRKKAAWLCGGIITAIGIPALLSFGVMADIKPFGMVFFDLYDFVTQNLLLPFVGLATVLILGFTWSKDVVMAEVTNNGKLEFKLKDVWYVIIKWVSPILLILAFGQLFIEIIRG